MEQKTKNNKEEIKNIINIKEEESEKSEEEIINLNESSEEEKEFIVTKLKKDKPTIIKFKGINKDNVKKVNSDGYVYLRIQNEFDTTKQNMEYNWKLKFRKISKKNKFAIGIGLAEEQFKTNHKKFINLNNGKINGIYLLYSKFDQKKQKFCVYHNNSNDSIYDKCIGNFPNFSKGQEISMSYNSFKNELSFHSDRKVKTEVPDYKMQILTNPKSENKKLVPCVIFYNSGDKIEITKIEINKIEIINLKEIPK